MVEFSRGSGRIVAIAAALALLLAPVIGDALRAQTRDEGAAGSVNLGARSGLTAEAPVGTAPRQDGASSPFEFSARAGFASDYIYRGVTLSDRKPAVGAGLEAALGLLYGGTTVTSVALPSRPAAEITAAQRDFNHALCQPLQFSRARCGRSCPSRNLVGLPDGSEAGLRGRQGVPTLTQSSPSTRSRCQLNTLP